MARVASVPGEALQAPEPPSVDAAPVVAPPSEPVSEVVRLTALVESQAADIADLKALVLAVATKKPAEAAPVESLPSQAEARQLAAQPGAKAVLSQDGYVMPPARRVINPLAGMVQAA